MRRTQRVGAIRQAVHLLLLGWLVAVLAVTPIYDETLWTKQLWHKWKVDRSQFSISPSQENPRLLSNYGVRDVLHNSLDGPLPRHKKGAKDTTVDADALDDDSFLPAASMAVKCSVCQTLLARVWQKLVEDILHGRLSVSVVPQFAIKYLTEACDTQVLELLQRKVIYRLEMDVPTDQSMTFFVLRARKPGTTPTSSEHAAVKMACRDLIAKDVTDFSNLLQTQLQTFKGAVDRLLLTYGVHPPEDLSKEPKAGSDDSAVDLPALIKEINIDASELAAAKQVLQHMVSKLLKGIAVQLRNEARALRLSDTSIPHEDMEEYDDADEDDMDEEDEPCKDLHPQCEQWANAGECIANPNYMVGNARLKGHCRKACGICTPRLYNTTELLATLPSLVKSVRELNTAVLKAVQSQGCTLKQACLTSGEELSAHGNMVSSKSRPGQATSLQSFKGVPQGAGFVLGRPFWAEPEVVETAESKAVYELQKAADKTHSSETDKFMDLQYRVTSALGKELGGKLLRVHEDFFTFEYMWRNHTRHFHDEPRHSGQVTEAWVLGNYMKDSYNMRSPKGGYVLLEPLDLLPSHTSPLDHDEDDYADDDEEQENTASGTKNPLMMEQRSWPYLMQLYANGDQCDLGNGKKRYRQTEVRIACSPDDKLHFLIREPKFCQYVFVIYSPAMCSIDRYKPLPGRTPGAKAA